MAEESFMQGPKITLHWLDKSRAHRILWLFEELGVEYELKTYKRGENNLAPKELRDVHPLGKSPVITVQGPYGDTKVIAESGPIVEYITHYYGPKFIPKRYPEGGQEVVASETEEWMRYRYYMHYSEGSLMLPLVLLLVMSSLKGPMIPFFIRPLTRAIANQVEGSFIIPEVNKHFKFLEDQLATSGGDYICGPNLTAADFMMIFPLGAAMDGDVLDKQKYPKIVAYVQRLLERDAWKKAVQVAEEKTGEKFSMVPS